MKTVSLNSGSNGNCFYIESNGVRIVVEAGLTGKQYESRLAKIDIHPSQIDAVLVSHEHCDHIAGAGVISRKYGTPIYMTEKTAAVLPQRIGEIKDLRTYLAGQSFQVGSLVIQTVPAKHDCAGGVHYVITDGEFRLGVITDAGQPHNILHSMISTLDVLFLESNYDPKLLSECHYPQSLKTRIMGGYGHLSNLQAAQMVRNYASQRLKYLILCHISDQANTFSLVNEIHRKIHQGDYKMSLAPRDDIGEIIDLLQNHKYIATINNNDDL